MAALHPTNTFNVEATLNQWVMDQIDALDKPSWLASFSYFFDAPEAAMVLPAFSVYHLPVENKKRWQGDNTGSSRGSENVSLMDVSCWASRANQNWAAQLRTMRAFVDQVFAASSVVVIDDYLTDPSDPNAVSYLIRLERLDWDRMMISDSNPDVERFRALARYSWIQRS